MRHNVNEKYKKKKKKSKKKSKKKKEAAEITFEANNSKDFGGRSAITYLKKINK